MLEIDRIKLLAKERHRSLSYICENIGLKSRSFFSDVEANKVQLTEERLQQIADILGTTTDYLHGKTDKKEKPDEIAGLSERGIRIFNIMRKLSDEQLDALELDLYRKGLL